MGTHYRSTTVRGHEIHYREACPRRRPGPPPAARLPHQLPHVPRPHPPPRPPLLRHRPGPHRLRPLRHPLSAGLHVHLRRTRRRHRGVHRADRPDPLRALRAGLRRPHRSAPRARAPRARHRDRHAERQRVRGGPRRRGVGARPRVHRGAEREDRRARTGDPLPGGHQVAVHARGSRPEPPEPGRLAPRCRADGPRRPGRDPALPDRRLRQQHRPVLRVPGVLPRLPGAAARRLGRPRPDLRAGRRPRLPPRPAGGRGASAAHAATSPWRRTPRRSAR